MNKFRNDLNIERILSNPTLNHQANLVVANLLVLYPVTEEEAHVLGSLCNYEWYKVQKAGEKMAEGHSYRTVREWVSTVRGIDV